MRDAALRSPSCICSGEPSVITWRTTLRLLAGEVAGEHTAGAPADQAHRPAVASVEGGDAVADAVEHRPRRADVGAEAPAVGPVAPAADERAQRHGGGVVAHEPGQHQHRMAVAAPDGAQPRRRGHERADLEQRPAARASCIASDGARRPAPAATVVGLIDRSIQLDAQCRRRRLLSALLGRLLRGLRATVRRGPRRPASTAGGRALAGARSPARRRAARRTTRCRQSA